MGKLLQSKPIGGYLWDTKGPTHENVLLVLDGKFSEENLFDCLVRGTWFYL